MDAKDLSPEFRGTHKLFAGLHPLGSQPFDAAVAYHLGRLCPVGRELDLLLGLDSFWPRLPASEAFDHLLQGLADRFTEPSSSTSSSCNAGGIE